MRQLRPIACFRMFHQIKIDRNPILTTTSGKLTLYLNSHSVSCTLAPTVDQCNFVSSTLRSIQCKDRNFCSCSIDVFLNATLKNTLWNRCVEVYVMFVYNGEGGSCADELQGNIVEQSIEVVLPHQGNVVTFQHIERIWRIFCKCWC